MGYNIGMPIKSRTGWRSGWRLAKCLERDSRLLQRLVNARRHGASLHELSLLVYERTGIRVDPTTVREWLEKLREEKDEK
jgi:hypothetical protein